MSVGGGGIQDVRRQVLARLADAAAEQAREVDRISSDDSLREDLGLGSLDSILLVIDLEEQLGIDIEDDELASLDTVGSLLDLVEAKIRATESASP